MTKKTILIHARDVELHFVYEAYIEEAEGGVHIWIPSSKANMKVTVERLLETCGWHEAIKEASG